MIGTLGLFAVAAGLAGPLPAFPEADGHGAFARGGRGGRIIPVTSLADTGPGTLRACIDARGPRVCVFRVSGVIRFAKRRPIIANPYLTIAGETAPGGGILLTHAGGHDGLTPVAIRNSHDIVIRHIRVRTDRWGESRAGNSAFTIEESRNVILDHVSGSWALDQNMTGQGYNNRITVSNAIFAEGIPRHDKCALLASDPRRPQNFSFVRNLCAHNGDRNPDVNFPPGSCIEVGNNILYNAQSQFAEVWEGAGGTPVSITGNIFRRGPDTIDAAAAIDREIIASTGPAAIHAEGNLLDRKLPLMRDLATQVRVPRAACPASARQMPARDAWVEVLSVSGALPRDAVDRRIVAETIARTGRIRRSPGDLPLIAAAAPYPDRDADGMDDMWEARHGANPAVADAWQDADRDGWSNLENFLDWRHRQLLRAARAAQSRPALLNALEGQRPQD